MILKNSTWKVIDGPETITVLNIFPESATLVIKWTDTDIEILCSKEYFIDKFEKVK